MENGRREEHATGPPSPRWRGAMAGSLRQDPGLPFSSETLVKEEAGAYQSRFLAKARPEPDLR
jgi:hypothetical protein